MITVNFSNINIYSLAVSLLKDDFSDYYKSQTETVPSTRWTGWVI